MLQGGRNQFLRAALVLVIGTCIVLTVLNGSGSTITKDMNMKNSLVKSNVIQLEAETVVSTAPMPKTDSTKLSLRDGEFMKSIQLKGLAVTGSTRVSSDYSKEELVVPITTSVVKSFSPQVEEHVKQIFNDEYRECKFYATLPAMVKRNRRVQVIQRIWLAQYEKMSTYYKKTGKNMHDMVYEWNNTWQENYLYSMQLDENYNQIEAGSIMGLPTTTNTAYTYKSDGPMDPRLFTVGDNTYLSFHTWLVDSSYDHRISGRLHLYDMNRHIKKKLTLNTKLLRTEINWIPLDINGELYYTYSLDPLRVMKCNQSTAHCRFIYEQKESSRNPFVYSSDHLRGGTPWVLYKYPYYISVGHNVVVTKSPYFDYSLYNSNIIVMSVDPWRIVYVSSNIEYSEQWLNSTRVVRTQTILRSFFYPCGALLRDDDVLDVSGHLNDAAGYILRFRGIKRLMDSIISGHSQHLSDQPPPIRAIQQYVLESSKSKFTTWNFTGDIIKNTVETR